MSQHATTTDAEQDDPDDLVAAFLTLFGPEPEPEPQPATINWADPTPVAWALGGFALTTAQLNATTDPPGLALTYDPDARNRLGVGTHTLTASLSPGQNYVAQPKQASLTVNKLRARIVWNQPQPLTWAPGGVSAGEGELNAVTDPPGGKIAYEHGTQGKLTPGEHRITAKIAEGEPYEADPVVQTLTVKKAKAKIAWDTPAPVPWVPNGFVVGPAQLNAATDPPNLKLVYSGHDGGGKEVGDHALTAKLDESNYEAEDKSVTLKVTKADPQLSWKKASGSFDWKPNLTVNANFASNLNNPLNLPITYNPPINSPLAVGSNDIAVTATDAVHYDQTPKTFTLTIRPLKAEIGLIKEIEVPADQNASWTVDVSAVEARTKPPNLALAYDPPNGTTIYAGNDGITVSLDPSVTNYKADQGWAKIKLVFPPKAQPGEAEDNDTTSTKISKTLLNREYPYGAGNVTPHIHHYGNSYHIKLAGGQRLNLVQNGTVYPDNFETALQDCSRNERLVAIINAIRNQY